MARIYIRDLELECIIGCKSEEKTAKREVILNIEMEVDAEKPSKTDKIEDAVDYAKVVAKVSDFVEGSSFNLLEKLASSIAELILAEFEIKAVKVCIDKPGAVPNVRSVAVEMEFGQG
ncbi:dihydroneopterin aldolase [Candidatus Margulisiibacteriota bacterium]